MKRGTVIVLLVSAVLAVALTSCRESPALTRAAQEYKDELYGECGDAIETLNDEEVMEALEQAVNNYESP